MTKLQQETINVVTALTDEKLFMLKPIFDFLLRLEYDGLQIEKIQHNDLNEDERHALQGAREAYENNETYTINGDTWKKLDALEFN